MLRIPYASDAAVEFADRSMEAVAYYAYWASTELADERGRYSSYTRLAVGPRHPAAGIASSCWPSSAAAIWRCDTSTTLDWEALRQRIAAHGMRNSNCLAIAPTATIANIVGVCASIEPTYQNIYVKSNLSGEFTVVNEYLVRDLKALGLWDEVMVADIKYFDGSLAKIDRIPAELRALYATAFEIEPKWLVEAGRAPAEVDRPGAEPQPLHGRRLGQEARRDLQARLAARPEDHLLPADAGRDACREIHRPGRRAQCSRSAGGSRLAARSCRSEVLRDRRSDVRGMPVTSCPQPVAGRGDGRPQPPTQLRRSAA